MIAGSWLCLVLVLPNLKGFQEDKLFILWWRRCKVSISKNCWNIFFPEICYLLNLPNVFQNAGKSAHC